MSTLADFLRARGVPVWWEQRTTQAFNGTSEWGMDYGMAANSPVASITSGRVVHVEQANPVGSSVGWVVQVESDDGSLIHYQHLRAASVKEGQRVSAGQVVGTSGGCPANGYGGAYNCRYTDRWSTGPHIEVRYAPSWNPSVGPWNQAWQNPASVWARLAGESSGQPLAMRTSQTPGQSGSSGPCRYSIPAPQLGPVGGGILCMDGVIDGSIRAVLILFALVLIGLAVLIFARGDGELPGPREGARAALGVISRGAL